MTMTGPSFDARIRALLALGPLGFLSWKGVDAFRRTAETMAETSAAAAAGVSTGCPVAYASLSGSIWTVSTSGESSRAIVRATSALANV